MIIKTQYSTLFDYHWYTNKQLMDCAAELGENDYFSKPEDGPGSIHEILFHILRADYGWRKGLETGLQQRPRRMKDYSDLDALKSGFEREQLSWQVFLDSLTEDEIKERITLTRLNGDEMVFFRWRILQHVLFHGMQHQSEIAHMLTSLDQSPGDIDFIFYR
jgi:uncharacterized damage-inducible protein DinB